MSNYAGVNLTAIYQDDELTDKETFQVEFEKRTDQWRLRTADDTYWILVESGSGIQSNGNSRYLIWRLINSYSSDAGKGQNDANNFIFFTFS